MQQFIQFMRRNDKSRESLADLAQSQRVRGPATWTVVNPGKSFQSPHLNAGTSVPDFEGYARFDDAETAALAAAKAAYCGVATQTFEVECFETLAADLEFGGAALEPGFVKRVAVVSRRPDLSRDAFVDYYERQHAPLAARVMPCIARYRRTFLGAPVGESAEGWPRLEFDAVTELYYRSEDDRQRFRDALSDPEVARQISEDEVNLFDRSAIHGLDVREVALDD